MGMNPGMYSSNAPDWSTPQELFDKLNKLFGPFDLDPASDETNFKCLHHFTSKENGLAQPWNYYTHFARVFLNPPYGQSIKYWMAKCVREAPDCALICALIPARTDTQWFHQYVLPYISELYFIKGRVKFDGGTMSAPFPSLVVIYRPQKTSLKIGVI